jgi:hypothetical protein
MSAENVEPRLDMEAGALGVWAEAAEAEAAEAEAAEAEPGT